jgi:hypothetical protein
MITSNLKDQKKPKMIECDFQPINSKPSDGAKTAEDPAEGTLLPPASAYCEVAAEQAQAPVNPRERRLLAKKAARKARKAQEAASTAKDDAEVAAASATASCEAPVDVAPGSDAAAGVATPYVADDPSLALESTTEPNSAKEEPFQGNFHKDESDSGGASTDETIRQQSGFRLRRRTGRWADDESGEEWELDEEERQQLLVDLDEEERGRLLGQFPDTTDDECSNWDGAWSEDEEDEAIAVLRMSGVEPSVPTEPGAESENGFQANGSCPAPRNKSKRRSRQRRRNKAKKRQVTDDWMRPFSELLPDDASMTPFPQLRLAPLDPADATDPRAPLVLQPISQPLLPPGQRLPSPMQPLLPPSGAQPVMPPAPGQPMLAPAMKPMLPNVNPTGPAVCIWNSTSPSAAAAGAGGNPKDVFTDGSQVFQPVPSTTGQPLFTDGTQLFASVCVMFAAPPSSEVVGPPLAEPSPEPGCMMDGCETVDEHSSDADDWD